MPSSLPKENTHLVYKTMSCSCIKKPHKILILLEILRLQFILKTYHRIHFSIRLKRRKCPWFWASFLGSSNYTDAKKIPEKLLYWHHLACFFQNKICQKIFFGLNSSGRSKNWLQPKKFFLKNDQKKTFSKRLRKNSQLFFDAKFF